MSSLTPNPEALKAFEAHAGEGPVVMLSRLKFKPGGGAEAYGRYAAAVSQMVQERGGRILYACRAKELLVGEETWDAVALSTRPFMATVRLVWSAPLFMPPNPWICERLSSKAEPHEGCCGSGLF